MFRLRTFQNFLQSKPLPLGYGRAVPYHNHIIHSKSCGAKPVRMYLDNNAQSHCYSHRESSTFCYALFARSSFSDYDDGTWKDTHFPCQLVNHHARDCNSCCLFHAPCLGDNASKSHWRHLGWSWKRLWRAAFLNITCYRFRHGFHWNLHTVVFPGRFQPRRTFHPNCSGWQSNRAPDWYFPDYENLGYGPSTESNSSCPVFQ